MIRVLLLLLLIGSLINHVEAAPRTSLVPGGTVVNIPKVTIREKINVIMEKLKNGQIANFRTLLTSSNRIEVVVSFLAMLELIKRHIIEADQDELFGDINLHSLREWDGSEITEFEFSD